MSMSNSSSQLSVVQLQLSIDQQIKSCLSLCDEANVNQEESKYVKQRLNIIQDLIQKNINLSTSTEQLRPQWLKMNDSLENLRNALQKFTRKIKIEKLAASEVIQKASLLKYIDNMLNEVNEEFNLVLLDASLVDEVQQSAKLNTEITVQLEDLVANLEQKDIKLKELLQELKDMHGQTQEQMSEQQEVLIQEIAELLAHDKKDLEDYIQNHFEALFANIEQYLLNFQSIQQQFTSVADYFSQLEIHLINQEAKTFCRTYKLIDKFSHSWEEFCKALSHYLQQKKQQVYELDKYLWIALKKVLLTYQDSNMVDLTEINIFFAQYLQNETKIQELKQQQEKIKIRMQNAVNYQGKILHMKVVKVPIDQQILAKTGQFKQRNTGLPIDTEFNIYPLGLPESSRYCGDYQVKIGRSTHDPDIENDIWFDYNEVQVSRKQTIIRYQQENDGWYILDEGSINGTMVKITNKMPLKLKKSQYLNIAELVDMTVDFVYEGSRQKIQPTFPHFQFIQTCALQRQGLQVLNIYKDKDNIDFRRFLKDEKKSIKDIMNLVPFEAQQKVQSIQSKQTLRNGCSTPPGCSTINFQKIALLAEQNENVTFQNTKKMAQQEESNKMIMNNSQQKPCIKLSFYFNDQFFAEKTLYADNQDNTQTFLIGRTQPPEAKSRPDLEISDFRVSSQQSRIVYDCEFGWLLFDGVQEKESANGTYFYTNDRDHIKKRTISLPYKIFDGLVVNISGTHFQFSIIE